MIHITLIGVCLRICDQIGGWATAGVGQAYGEGYNIDRKWNWMSVIVDFIWQKNQKSAHISKAANLAPNPKCH